MRSVRPSDGKKIAISGTHEWSQVILRVNNGTENIRQKIVYIPKNKTIHLKYMNITYFKYSEALM